MQAHSLSVALPECYTVCQHNPGTKLLAGKHSDYIKSNRLQRKHSIEMFLEGQGKVGATTNRAWC